MITNQKIIIEKWLLDYGSITGKQAMEECGIYRLSSVIHELRKRGLDITTKTLVVKNRYGGKSHVAQYTMNKNPKVKGFIADFNNIVERAMKSYRSVS
tara:strand:+ start:2430 stop:2723 length:294 start_codon:yes stop_codon:yes gene_type:complete